MRRFMLPIAGLTMMALSSAAFAAAPAGFTTLSDGVMEQDSVVGTGPVAQPGQTVVVMYTGWLYQDGQKGQKFDSSYDRNQPFSFVLGNGQVIAGWDAGVVGMKVGGERTLIIPPDQGYGDQGAGGSIPPGATLMFDVKLQGVN
ncbi:FKBP-type peptidyl-prolyl cis-trans isomerase [Acidisoma cellulosilyticum]|nr:FKBP-type peptidyl-prolyl cis-trans isomerase [Acidisoma cellulosilyticum]